MREEERNKQDCVIVCDGGGLSLYFSEINNTTMEGISNI
jgi:hypothetical protein